MPALADEFDEAQASLVRIERDVSSQVVVRAKPPVYRFAQPNRINGANANRYSRTLAPNSAPPCACDSTASADLALMSESRTHTGIRSVEPTACRSVQPAWREDVDVRL